jgi:hypothetical protein
VFAWREPGEVVFCEVKVGPDRIQDSRCEFLAATLRVRPLAEFLIIEMPRPARKIPAVRPSRPGASPRLRRTGWPWPPVTSC